MQQTLSKEAFSYILSHPTEPVLDLMTKYNISEKAVLSVIALTHADPNYNSKRMKDKATAGETYTIAQAMELTGMPYEFFNEAIMAGELHVARPLTASDSYTIKSSDMERLIRKSKNGGIGERKPLRSEESRKKFLMTVDDSTFFNYMMSVSLLTVEEERCLMKKVSEGDEAAVTDMAEANYRIVLSKAKAYRNICNFLSLDDLFQEGVMNGLIPAIMKYDLNKLDPDTNQPFKFSTYATWWISQAITRAIANYERTMRMPVHLYERRSRIGTIVTDFIAKHGREPMPEEVHEIIPEFPLYRIADDMKFMKFTYVSLDAENDDGLNFHNLIPDSHDASRFEDMITREEYHKIEKTILEMQMSERSKQILFMYYGVSGYEKHTLEQIGMKYNITRERVRQLKMDSIREINKKINVLNSKKTNGEILSQQLTDDIIGMRKSNSTIKQIAEKHCITPHKVRSIINRARRGRLSSYDTLLDHMNRKADEYLEILTETNQISDRDKEIYMMKYGHTDGRPYTYLEIAEKLKMKESTIGSVLERTRSFVEVKWAQKARSDS